jgi:hypothetical protein
LNIIHDDDNNHNNENDRVSVDVLLPRGASWLAAIILWKILIESRKRKINRCKRTGIRSMMSVSKSPWQVGGMWARRRRSCVGTSSAQENKGRSHKKKIRINCQPKT